MNVKSVLCHQSDVLCPLCLDLCPLKKRVGWNCRLLTTEFIGNFDENFAVAKIMQGRTENTYRDYPTSKVFKFFARFGNFNAYDYLPHRKEMPILLKIAGVFLLNTIGVYLILWWLMIDWAGIKVFVTSVGVFAYAGMKMYEKYLDIKEKKRKTEEEKRDRDKHSKHNY